MKSIWPRTPKVSLRGRCLLLSSAKSLARLPHLSVERRLARLARRRLRRRRSRRSQFRWLAGRHIEELVGAEELLAQLVRSLAEIADDAAHVAHDLRQPLGAEHEQREQRDE